MISISKSDAKAVHPLARFVSLEAVALLLNLKPHEIYRIDCWRYVIHVVGKGISTFVSYADIPPILGVEPPKAEDINCWRKRWRKNKHKAPSFWVEFYSQKFKLAPSVAAIYRWGELVNLIKFALPETGLQVLRNTYKREKAFIEDF